jgi:predicted ATP-grasp superfamily ATP-dependent carboligase
MEIKINGTVVAELTWEGMGELTIVHYAGTDYALTQQNMYDFSEALLMWVDNNDGKAYMFDTASVIPIFNEAEVEEYHNGITGYVKLLASRL